MARRPTRLLILVAAALVALGVLGAAGYALLDSDTETLETPEFSFDYPSGWERIEGVEFPNAERLGDTGVGDHTVGIDPDTWVTVFTSPVGAEVTTRNVNQVVPVARELYSRTLEPASRPSGGGQS